MHRQRVEIKPELVKYIERLLEKQGKTFLTNFVIGIEYYEKNVVN